MIHDTIDRVHTPDSAPHEKLSGDAGHYFQTLLCQLPWAGGSPADDKILKTVGITSYSRGEGVSTVAVQLAIAAASSGENQVLLVDANFVCPRLHRIFGYEVAPGLSEVLGDVDQFPAAIHATPVVGLSALTTGKIEGNATASYAPERFSKLLQTISDGFDLIIFDLPAALHIHPAIHLASLLDGVLLVVEAERTRSEAAHCMIDQLTQSKVNLLGAVLNKQRFSIPH